MIRTLRTRTRLLSLLLTVMLAVSVHLQVQADVVSEEGRLLNLINQERTSRGLGVLAIHPLLTQAARNYSREMMEHGFFSHVSEVDGSTVLDRIKRTGYYDGYHGSIVVRENIALISGPANAASAHQGFMNSEGHRLNLIASDVNEVGIGITEGLFQSVFGSIYVEVFAYHTRDQQTTVSATVTPNDITVQRGEIALFAVHADSSVSTSALIQVVNLPSSLIWSVDKSSGATPLDAKLTVTTTSATVGTYEFSILVTIAGQTRMLPCRLNILQSTVTLTTSTTTSINTNSKTTGSTSYSTQTSTITSTSKIQSNSSNTSTAMVTQTNTYSSSLETSRNSTSTIPTSSSTRATLPSITTTTPAATAYVTTSTRTTTSTIALPTLRCVIATAAFGSELSAEVQLLREFRDEKVMLTLGGRLFMSVFNRPYYSISPTIAEFIAQHSSVAFIVRALVYPLVFILHLTGLVFDYLRLNPEIAVATAGLLASSLVGLTYLLPVLTLLDRILSAHTRQMSILAHSTHDEVTLAVCR